MHQVLQKMTLIPALASFRDAWGNLGHRTVALLAQKYLTIEGKSYADNLLGSMAYGDAAVWADVYKNTPAGAYINSWHFMDAMDHPPTTFNVSYTRNCKAARTCIITTMKNMVCSIDRAVIKLRPTHNSAH